MDSFSHCHSHQFQTEPQFHPHPHLQPQCQPQQRGARGFAATSNAAPELGGATHCTSIPASSGGGKARREREKEKERTKLRERHRRAITSRMLSGLRQYGNLPLPARADMNDVLAALAREAGWIVKADGTTYRPSPPPSQMKATLSVKSTESPLSGSSLKNCYLKASLESQPSVLRIDESLSPASFDSVVVTERDSKTENYATASPMNSSEYFEAHQLMQDVPSGEHANSFAGTPFIPVYVMLASGVINSYCQLIDPEGIRQELRHLKSLNVDGVAIECWWGIVEGWNPQKYVWSGYRELFMIIQEYQLKVQVVMAFHEYGAADTQDTLVSLPQWVLAIGHDNPDIFFTDRQGRRNTGCLSWGIDKERVLRGRTGVEVYFDFMRSFRTEFDDFFTEGCIASVEIGLGASGELKFPSHSKRMGWRYPGIGEFQCYDRYLQQDLRKVAKLRGHSSWARGPDNAGQYNSRPLETGFFCERGDYDSHYGRFFLHWYAQTLVDHADNVLSLASLAFEETNITVKIPAIYWWYKTASHAAELTAGFYNPTNQEGYSPVFEILKKHSAKLRFAIPGSHLHGQENNEPFADPDGLTWQVLNAAWDDGLTVTGENSDPCYDRGEHIRVVDASKPRNDPDQRHFSFFTYRLPSLLVQRTYCFTEMDHFIKSMHGEVSYIQE